MRWFVPRVVAALIIGLVHAVLVLGVALRYGYDVGPAAYPVHIVIWRYGGLVVLGAVPVWLALEDRLLLPLVLIMVLAGLAFSAELTPPGPTFRDVADLEPGIDEPTGITVVEHGLHLVKYASPWYVWTVGAGLLGAVEHSVRTRSRWLPTPGWDLPISGSSREAVLGGLVAGVMHAAASVAYAWQWGIGDDLLMLMWMLAGGILMVGVPAYLLVRHRLVLPLTVAALLFVHTVHSQQYAGPSDPHALYAAGWVLFLGITLLTGVLEYAVYTVSGQDGQRGQSV